MKLLSTLRASSEPRAWNDADACAVEPVRQAMLEALAGASPLLDARVRHAAGLQRLWDLRGPLMECVAARHCEAHAARELARITALFGDHLPQGLASGLARRDPRAA